MLLPNGIVMVVTFRKHLSEEKSMLMRHNREGLGGSMS